MKKYLTYLLCTLLLISCQADNWTGFTIRKGIRPKVIIGVVANDRVKQVVTQRDVTEYMINKTNSYKNIVGYKHYKNFWNNFRFKSRKYREYYLQVDPYIIADDSLSGMYIIDLKGKMGFSVRYVRCHPYGLAFILDKEAYFFDNDSIKNMDWLSKHDSAVHKILNGQNGCHGKYEDFAGNLKSGNICLRE